MLMGWNLGDTKNHIFKLKADILCLVDTRLSDNWQI